MQANIGPAQEVEAMAKAAGEGKEVSAGEAIGYRYSMDEEDNLFIIKLLARDERPDGDDIWKSNHCVCLSITNANTGKEEDRALLRGVRGKYIDYRKNQKIPGGVCWYYHTEEALYKSYLLRGTDGVTCLAFSVRKLKDLILKGDIVSPEAVAAELNISTQKLRLLLLTLGEQDAAGLGLQIMRAVIVAARIDLRL